MANNTRWIINSSIDQARSVEFPNQTPPSSWKEFLVACFRCISRAHASKPHRGTLSSVLSMLPPPPHRDALPVSRAVSLGTDASRPTSPPASARSSYHASGATVWRRWLDQARSSIADYVKTSPHSIFLAHNVWRRLFDRERIVIFIIIHDLILCLF